MCIRKYYPNGPCKMWNLLELWDYNETKIKESIQLKNVREKVSGLGKLVE